MDNSFWVAILFGAIFVGCLSAFMSYSQSNESLKVKGVIRDALIGGGFVAILWQFIPDSMNSMVSSLPSVDKVFKTVSGGDMAPDFELQTGPPRF